MERRSAEIAPGRFPQVRRFTDSALPLALTLSGIVMLTWYDGGGLALRVGVELSPVTGLVVLALALAALQAGWRRVAIATTLAATVVVVPSLLRPNADLAALDAWGSVLISGALLLATRPALNLWRLLAVGGLAATVLGTSLALLLLYAAGLLWLGGKLPRPIELYSTLGLGMCSVTLLWYGWRHCPPHSGRLSPFLFCITGIVGFSLGLSLYLILRSASAMALQASAVLILALTLLCTAALLAVLRFAHDAYKRAEALHAIRSDMESQLARQQLAEQALRESDQRFRHLTANISDIVFRAELHPIPRLTYVSPALTTLLGYQPEAFYANPQMLRETIHPDDLDLLGRFLSGHLLDQTAIMMRWYSVDQRLFWFETRATPLYDAAGVLVAFEGAARDMSDRVTVEAALREQRDLYQVLLQGLSDLGEGVLIGEGSRLTYVNDAFCAISGFSRDELLAHPSAVTLLAPDYIAAHEQQQEDNGFRRFESDLRCKDGQKVPMESAIKLLGGDPQRYLAVTRNISQRRANEQALKDSQARLAGILDGADEAIIVMNERHEIMLFNQGAERIFGYKADALEGKPSTLLLPLALGDRDYQRVFDATGSNGEDRSTGKRQTIVARRADGSTFPAEVSVSQTYTSGEKIYTAILHDISARNQAEAQIRSSLHEKEMLLQEIHHRVKNNLQVISSLLRLQAASVDDPFLHELLRESQNRVRAMALAHDQLYRSGDLSHIDIASYIRQVATTVLHSYESVSRSTALCFAIETLPEFDLTAVIPLGMILCELVTNCMKHAFNDGRVGLITVSAATQDDRLVLAVSDNGVGLPSDLHARMSSSLGLQLISDLTEQLCGTLTITRHPTTVFQVRVPLARGKEAS